MRSVNVPVLSGVHCEKCEREYECEHEDECEREHKCEHEHVIDMSVNVSLNIDINLSVSISTSSSKRMQASNMQDGICRHRESYQNFCGESQWRLWQTAMVHESNCSSPIAMAVKETAHGATIHDARKGLVGFGQLDVSFKSLVYSKAFQLQAILV